MIEESIEKLLLRIIINCKNPITWAHLNVVTKTDNRFCDCDFTIQPKCIDTGFAFTRDIDPIEIPISHVDRIYDTTTFRWLSVEDLLHCIWKSTTR